MKLLALDTSTLTLSLALLEGEGSALTVAHEVVRGPPDRQSELLPGVIGAAVAARGWTVRELDALVMGLGPGSFTGLRIGLSTLKAIAYATRAKLVGVSSLRAVALAGPEGAPLFTLAVARKDDLYLGRYVRRGGGVETLEAETAMSPAEVAALMIAEPAAVALGPALAEYRAKLEAAGVASHRLLDVAPFPRAVDLARLAEIPAEQPLESVFSLEPHYIRTSGAERNPQFPPLPGPPPAARLKD